METASHTARIRELNDEFRCAERFVLGSMAFGQVVITRGIEAKGNTFVLQAFERVRTFEAFTDDNDPHGEHDFGSFEFDGESVFWKIDLYERELVKRAINREQFTNDRVGTVVVPQRADAPTPPMHGERLPQQTSMSLLKSR